MTRPGDTYAGWALGSFSTSVLVNAMGLLLMRFMTDELGLAAALAASILALSKVYDGVTDPIMGVISDRTRSRWGRRRPYLLAGAFMCALAMFAAFNVPRFQSPTVLAIYMTFVLLFFATAYTIFRIPYLSMGADLTRSFRDRSRLMSFSVYGSSLGSLFATTAAPFLLAFSGGGRDAHGMMALALGVLILISGLGCFRLTAGVPDGTLAASTRFTWREKLDALAQNRPFILLMATKVLLFVGLAVHISGIAYFTKHVLQASDYSLGTLFLLQTLAAMLSQPLWIGIANRLGRRNGLMTAIGMDVLIFSAYWFVPAGGANSWLAVLGPLSGIATGGMFLNIQCMLPDTMNFDEQRHGLRREGLFAGIFVMVEKFTSAIGTAVFGAIIGAMGYAAAAGSGAAQPVEALVAIRACVSFVPSLILIASMLVLARYRLPQDWLERNADPQLTMRANK
jgi:glycoside/pentoside/hexuronide:cation symporter, GPH family